MNKNSFRNIELSTFGESTYREKETNAMIQHAKMNESLILSAIETPLDISNRKTKSMLELSNRTVIDIEAEVENAESKEQQSILEEHEEILNSGVIFHIFYEQKEYFEELNAKEQEYYNECLDNFEQQKQFIINITDCSVDGNKISNAFNLDEVINYSSVLQFCDGELRSYYLKMDILKHEFTDISPDVLYQEVDKVIKRWISHINECDCVLQTIELLVNTIEFTTHPDESTILHAIIYKKANSLGISRALSLILRYFNVKSSVVCADNSKNEKFYWNLIEYTEQYIISNKNTLQQSMFQIETKRRIFSYVDISQTIINKQTIHIPEFTINIDEQRVCEEYRMLPEFNYPDSVSLHMIQDQIVTNVNVREIMKIIAQELKELDFQIKLYYYDVFIKTGKHYQQTVDWIERNWQILISMTMRYAPRFRLVNYVTSKTITSALTLVFERTINQDLFLYNRVLSEFDDEELHEIVRFVNSFCKNIRQLVIPLSTDYTMTEMSNRFPESKLADMLEDKIFNSSDYLDSCIFGYSEPAMLIVILFIHVPMINNVPKYARKNRFTLNPELRYIYSYIVRNLLNNKDKVTIPYTNEISQQQMNTIMQCIRLDYPELFYIPSTNILINYEKQQRELHICLPIPDVTVLEMQRKQLNELFEQLPNVSTDDFRKEKLLIQFIINNIYKDYQLEGTAVSIYDSLVLRHISSQSLALAFSILCHKLAIPACAIESQVTLNCCNLVWIQGHCTAVDLFTQLESRLKLKNDYFYPTFSINITRSLYKQIDKTMPDFLLSQARFSLNFIFNKFEIDIAGGGIQKLKLACEEELQHFQENLIVQISHKDIPKEQFLQYLTKNMTFVAAYLLQKKFQINPCYFKFTCCKNVPVVLIQLKFETNFLICDCKCDNLNLEIQKIVGKQVLEAACQNKAFSLLRLSTRTLSEFYAEQYVKYDFEKNIKQKMLEKATERGEEFYVIPCFNEYCIIFIFIGK